MTPDAASAAPPAPPSTGLLDLLGLLVRMLAALMKSPRAFSARIVFRDWARGVMTRYGSENLVLNLGVTRLILVGGQDLSRRILEPPPRTDGFAVGKLKRKAMAVLAPHALTISDDAQWALLRPFNEAVLCAGHPHELRQAFVAQTRRAFSTPPATMESIRAAMRRAMLGIVFGDGVPARLVGEVEALFDLVQRPAKRILLGPLSRRRRARFYDTLRRGWRDSAGSQQPSLLGLAHGKAGDIDQELLLEQIPHWMFTFTGSGTDLLVRALTLVSSDPGALATARREIAAAGSLDAADSIAGLRFVEACLLEAARMYPPVTRTTHQAPAGAVAGTVRISPGMELLHSFPLLGRSDQSIAEPMRFRPERWLSAESAAAMARDFDPFLFGARHCPGRELILFVCQTALATLIGPHRLVVEVPLPADALPPAFPTGAVRFRQSNG